MRYTLFALALLAESSGADATIDVNLPELEYLAARLDPRECRRLVAALHYDSYELLPESLAEAERKIDAEIPCVRQLLHWNSAPSEGRGKTHEHIQHRLRQIGRGDLADWLGRTTFRELSKDLFKSLDEPIAADKHPITRDVTATAEAYGSDDEMSDDDDDESFWYSIELSVIGLFALLSFALCFVIGAFVIDKFAWCDDDDEAEDIDHRKFVVITTTAGRQLKSKNRATSSTFQVVAR